ncbi:WxL domain-containing protein [Carnobacterium maltaromaticum]
MKFMKLISISAATMTLVGALGTTVLAAEEPAVYKSSAGVEFIPNTDPTQPVDPENPDPTDPVVPIDPTDPEGKPNPGTNGPLSLDYASSLDFGQNKITNSDQTYYAAAQAFSGGAIAGEFRGNYVQVSDNRGTSAGWTLSLKQEGQFSSAKANKYKVLEGAQIAFASATAESNAAGVTPPTVSDFSLVPNESVVVMQAAESAGDGTWVDRFGNAEVMSIDGKDVQKNKAISLAVPGKTPKEATNYVTELTWTLSDVPAQGTPAE